MHKSDVLGFVFWGAMCVCVVGIKLFFLLLSWLFSLCYLLWDYFERRERELVTGEEGKREKRGARKSRGFKGD